MYSFPKIFQLGTVYVQDIFNEPVEITEKIDGSHFKFWIDEEGHLKTFSRGSEIFPESSDKLFKPVLEWAHSIKDKLGRGTVYYGETLCRPKHNVLTYNRVPTNNFCLFGCSLLNNTEFLNHYELIEIAEVLGCDVVPLLFEGKIADFKELPGGLLTIVNHHLEKESYLGGPKIEGIVIKNYTRQAMISNIIMPIMNAKYVSEEFKESHRNDIGWQPKGEQVELLFQDYRTKARWYKAIQHLKESGEIVGAPQDIGKLMNEIVDDIVTDHKEEIKEKLWNIYFKKYHRQWNNGFPEFYKEYLLKGVDCEEKS